MRVFINLFFCFLIFSSLSSCGRSQKTGAESEGAIVVRIDPTREDKVSVFDYFSDIRIIPLVGSSPDAFLSADFYGLIVTDANIFVLDMRTNKILCFDAEGKWLQTVDKNGRGNGEFSLSSDFIFDRRDSTLVVLDPRGKILKYAVEPGLPFIKQFDVSSYVRATHTLTTLNDEDFLLYSDSEDQPMFIFESETQSCRPVDYHYPSWAGGFLAHNGTPFLQDEDTLYFYKGLDGDVFRYDNASGDLRKILRWDFGKYALDINELEPDKDADYYIRFRQSNSHRRVLPVHIKLVTESFIFLHFYFKKARKQVFYDRTNNSCVCFTSFKEGGVFWNVPGCGYAGREYSLVSPEYFSKIISREMLRDPASLQAFDNMKDTDNHYLVVYTLK